MKTVAFLLLLAICTIECRKIVPISKNANIDFINMEMGGGARPANVPVRPTGPGSAPAKPQSPEPPKSPTTGTGGTPAKPVLPAVTTAKPVPAAVPTVPPPTPIKPVQPIPNQMDLKPVNTARPASAGGVTTPGYGNVQQLVTFYDSHGKASVIRPYSYSTAVKQG